MSQRTASAAELTAGLKSSDALKEIKDPVTIGAIDLATPFLMGEVKLGAAGVIHNVIVVGKNFLKFCSVGDKLESTDLESLRYYSSQVVANAAYRSLCAGEPLLRSLEGRDKVEMIQHLATTSK